MGYEILVTLTRSGLGESHHHGAYCVIEDGRVARSRGDIDTPVYLRSAAKPFQALAVVESGAMERFDLTEEELALVCASHSSSPHQVRAALSILGKAGEGPGLLRCGGHRPLDTRVYEEFVRKGERPGRIEDNCSGKHAGMIAAAKALGADPVSYADPSHPVQLRNRANLALLAGMPEPAIRVGVDGCAVPTFGIGLRDAARAMARHATPEELPTAKADAARRIARAMLAYPEMVAGEGRFDTVAMRAGGGRLLVKSGAEGVMIVGVVGARTAIAATPPHGADRALHAVVAALLIGMGLADEAGLEQVRPRDVRTREGVPVGDVEVLL